MFTAKMLADLFSLFGFAGHVANFLQSLLAIGYQLSPFYLEVLVYLLGG